MILRQVNPPITEEETLRNEIQDLKDRLVRLSQASISIFETPDPEAVFQEVVQSASRLTGAQYGALLTFNASDGVGDFYTYGISREQREHMPQSPQGLGLLGYMNKVRSPVRVKDMASHTESVGLPENHPPMTTFLGVPLYHRDEHVGNLYLTEKEGGQEFTPEDELVASMFAAQAASIIAITRRYEAEHRAKGDLETLLDISPTAVTVFDARIGEITFMNQECRRILGAMGILDEEIERLYELLRFTSSDGRDIPFVDLPGTRTLQTGETVRAEEIVVHLPDGTAVTTLVNCAPLFSETGEIVSVMSVVQDMSSLEELERQRGEFLGLVSEELRVPVATIKGSALALGSVLEPLTSTESTQLLRIIDQQTDLMRSQVNSLAELTQIETGSLSVAAEPTDVARLLEGSCREYLGDHAAIAIQLDVPDGLPTVSADRRRIGQVLHNFLRQAAKHSNETSPLKVSASMVDIYVAISVSVEGALAPPEVIPSPFKHIAFPQPFKRVSQAHSKTAESYPHGEGLALAFCRGVVEAHGGRMRTVVQKEDGRLTLTFTLQSVEDEGETPIPHIQGIAGEGLPVPTEKSHILVSIEDPRLLAAVRRVLQNAGYTAVAAARLDEVEQLALRERPKLILLDIAGREEECFRTLQRAGSTLNLPAIVFCDRHDEDYVVRAFDMGADGYMLKPFSPSELIARIRATLRRSTASAESTSSKTFQLGDVLINFDERTVNVSGQPMQLTATEYKLLTELSNSAGRVLTQDELLRRVWGPEYLGESQLLRSYVKSLRQKLGDDARNPSYIFTEHGIGYRMAKSCPKANQPGPVSSEPLGSAQGSARALLRGGNYSRPPAQ
jgi:DNA-binding response OmpR family regulator/signal transduction histidine kinase